MNQESLISKFPKEVSFFGSVRKLEPDERAALGDVLYEIRAGTWAKEIAILRKRLNRGDQKGYDEAKRNLPGFTMSANLRTRDKKESLEHRLIGHSGILQADFDLKENPQMEVEETKRLLSEDPHVAFVFTSPSGRGVKAGVAVDPDFHRGCFFRAEAHFLKAYGLQMDKSTKDVTRMCFVSSDPEMVINDDCYPVEPMDAPQVVESSGYSAPLPTTAEDIREMLQFVARRPAYEDWLRIASAVWSVLPMAEGCQVLNEWSPEEKPGEYSAKWRNRLEHIGVGTLVWYAQQGGFDARAAARRKMWAGRIRICEPTMRAAAEDFTEDPAEEIREVELTREFVADCFENAQLGDAQLWASMVRGRKAYDHLARCWRTYEGGIWERDEMQSSLVECSDAIAEGYQVLIKSIVEDLANNPPQGKRDVRHEKIKAIKARIQKIKSTGYINGVMTFAESLLATKATLFDRHPGLLCVENGVIDFENGVFREHRPSDRLTKKAKIHFDPDAKCPRFMSFISYFMAHDEEMISYLARIVGYCLTGYIHEDKLFFFFGKGANGKSTKISVLSMLLGELMTTVSIDALLSERSDNNFDYKKAQMEGMRVVVSDEIPEDKTFNDASIKSLVGGDAITARRPYEKPYVFDPTHKLILVGNHKPSIKGTDHGIWRRIDLVPFNVTMPADERRPRHEVLSELREELPGILSWAVRGYIDMIDQGGINSPEKVRAATREYQSDSDQFSRFMEHRLESNIVDSVSVTDLRKTFFAWCEDEGERPRFSTNQKIAGYLRDCGHELQRRGNKNVLYLLGMTVRNYEDAI